MCIMVSKSDVITVCSYDGDRLMQNGIDSLVKALEFFLFYLNLLA